MFLAATGLILLGGLSAFMGQKLFRLLLPLLGFIAGVMVGFSGVQSVFGTGVISLSIALLMAIMTGLIFGLLSFLFLDLAVTILLIVLASTLFTYLGVALGLQDNGFVLLLLAVTGAALGLALVLSAPVTMQLVIGVTAFVGIGYILAGVLLFVGEISLDRLDSSGIIPTVLDTIDQSLLWIFAWIGGSLIAINVQYAILERELLNNYYEYMRTTY